ncbi:MAG: GntR family transcriptional regulator [Planctomycetota bacterium]|jgi:GntR family transcriptional regulator
MKIRIDDSSERAVYRQIMDKVKLYIALGRLKKGEKLATVRQLAEELEVDPNTTAKAYRQLEREGVIATKTGGGTFVASGESRLRMSVRKKMIRERLERIAVDAYHMGIKRGALAEWLKAEVKKLKFPKK